VPKGRDPRSEGPAPSRCTSRTIRSTTRNFEGVIPAGEYGGGDVIVWDRGTWELHKDKDAPQSRRRRRGPSGAARREAARQHRAGAHGRGELGQGELASCLHKRDEFAVDGWKTRRPSPISDQRAHERRDRREPRNDFGLRDGEVRAPGASFRGAPTDEELAGARRVGREGNVDVPRPRASRSPTSTRCCFPAAGREDPVTKRELIRYLRLHRADAAPPTSPSVRST